MFRLASEDRAAGEGSRAAAGLAGALLGAWSRGRGRRVRPWALPPAGSCAPTGGLRGWPIGQDAPPIPFQRVTLIDLGKAEILKNYLPPALWEQRDHFFFEGQRLEIGPCFRDYAPPAFFQEATEKERGKTHLQENGGIADYNAGLPFRPTRSLLDDPQAGLQWAWNVAERYQAGGFRAKFRVSDMVGRSGRAEPFEGELFLVPLSGRADRATADYRVPAAGTQAWVGGGLMTEPFAAREYAWRQYRDAGDPRRARSVGRSPRLPAGVATGTPHQLQSDRRHLSCPRSASGVQPASPAFDGGGMRRLAVGGVAIGVGGGGSITPKRTGFEGIVLRPLLYDFRLARSSGCANADQCRDAVVSGGHERNYGPWGLSFASDRWDLRRALVLEGRFKGTRGGDQTARLVLYVDLRDACSRSTTSPTTSAARRSTWACLSVDGARIAPTIRSGRTIRRGRSA